MRITPSNTPQHDALEAEVRAYLEARGFMVGQMVYHQKDAFSDELRNALRCCDDMTALDIRGEADLVAVHPRDGVCIRVEIKTDDCSRPNIAFEMRPLWKHMRNPCTKTLYAYRKVSNPGRANPVEIECGFWAASPPPFKQVWIPPRWKSNGEIEFIRIAEDLGLGSRIQFYRTNGSNDPYVLIDPAAMEGLPHWKSLIDELVCDDSVLPEPFPSTLKRPARIY